MARLSAHGTEVARLAKGNGATYMKLSFRSDGAVLKKTTHGTYDSGWKIHLRRTETPHAEIIDDLVKNKGWVKVHI